MDNHQRKGIISAGNWVVDSVKFIDVYPQKGNLTSITGVDEGLGGLAHNVLVDLASMRSGLPREQPYRLPVLFIQQLRRPVQRLDPDVQRPQLSGKGVGLLAQLGYVHRAGDADFAAAGPVR